MATSARPVALITGASAGIGAALAREAANHDLVLVARRREPMEALAAELKSTGAQITVIPADLNRPGAAAELMKTVEQRGLAIDTLINNAGLGDTGRFDQENPERILSMLQMTAAEVAREGYVALKAGRPEIITGLINKIVAISARFTPTTISLMIADRLNRPGRGQT
jgi:short-subunit dehydrogenase